MPLVPDAVTGRFEGFVARARRDYGVAVRARLLDASGSKLPMLSVGPFSVIAADGLVVDIAAIGVVPARRWELDWDDVAFEEAWRLLSDHLSTERLEPGRLDGFVARIVALVGDAGEVVVSTVQEEFDRVVTVTPRRRGAVAFEVLVIKDESAVVRGDDFGWWDLGGRDGDDGLAEALDVLTHFVLLGGTIRSTWRTCVLLDTEGVVVGGSYRDGVHRLRPRQLHFSPYVGELEADGGPQDGHVDRTTGVAEHATARYGCGMVSSPDAPSDLDPSSAGAAPVVVEDDVASDPDAAAPAPPVEREVLGWLEFGEAARHLARDVVAADFTPDVIVAVARGGLVLAGAISYALDTKMCGSINVEFYTGVDERLPEPVLLPPTLDAPALAGKRVLVVDDVSDSGRTLSLVRDLLAEVASEVRTVCLYSKPHTILEPDFTWKRTSQWITFPWSALPPVTRDAGQGDAS